MSYAADRDGKIVVTAAFKSPLRIQDHLDDRTAGRGTRCD